jgi:hypothetical protein
LRPPCWPLHVWNGNALVEVTVAEVLAQKYTYHGSLCLDPLEPDYDGRRFVGQLYLDQKMPCVNSFARGGQAYSLSEHALEIYLHANLHNATNDTLNILEQRMEAFNYGGSLTIPMKGKLCVPLHTTRSADLKNNTRNSITYKPLTLTALRITLTQKI